MKQKVWVVIILVLTIMGTTVMANNDYRPMRDYGRCYDEYGNAYPCHNMRARGRGDAYVYNDDGSRKIVIENGQASQCSRCKYILISQYNPFDYSEYELGIYFTATSDYWIRIGGTTLTFEKYEQKYSNTIPEEFCFEK